MMFAHLKNIGKALFAAVVLMACNHGTAIADENFFSAANVLGKETDEYKPMTYTNLSKMYWAINKFKFDDNMALAQYLQINECDLYQRYSRNEFEFQKILEATKAHLTQNIARLPTKLEILIPLKLADYDIEEKVFWIEEDVAPISVTKVDLEGFHPGVECNRHGNELSLYPAGLIVLFNRPFTINKIPVHPEVAKLYLDELARKYVNNTRNYERTVYLRVKVKMLQFRTQWTRVGATRAEVFARLEGYEIYADLEKQKLMYSENFLERRIRKAKSRRPNVEEASLEGEESAEPIESGE